MKKFILMLAMCFGLAFNTQAQEYRNELGVSYGYYTIPQFAYIFGGVLGAAFTLGHFTFDNTIMTGSFGMEYTRNECTWFGWGFSSFAEIMTADAYNVDKDGNKTPSGKFDMYAVSTMVTAKFKWFDRMHFGMYSKFGFGPGIFISDEAQIMPVIQVSPICMEFGGRSLRGIAEIGVGTQGVAVIGVKKSF